MTHPSRDLIRRSSVPFWRDVRVYRIAGQLIFVAVIAFIGFTLCANLTRGLQKFTSFNFDFLQSPASLPLAESPIPYDPHDPYYLSFVVGVLNTLKVVIVGIFLATILGLFGGIARLSTNWLIAKIAQVYVEIFRNTPLLIQLYFWYLAGVLQMPRVRESIKLPGDIFLSNRGLVMPWVEPTQSFSTWLAVAVGAIIAAGALYILLGRAPEASYIRIWRGALAFLGFVVLAVISALALGAFTPTIPELAGFNFKGGLALTPEYTALLTGLVVYTGAYITEIVRAGIQAVPRGLTEASYSIGMTRAQTLQLVVIPVALRVIIPPLTNQYLNLTKNSSLAVAIGYADLFYVGSGIFNQTGQTIQVIGMIMGIYLLMSLTIATLMSQVNARFKLVER